MRHWSLVVLTLLAPAALAAQEPAHYAPPAAAGGAAAPAPVTPDDYGRWEELGRPVLSRDGAWLAYTIERVNEENELRVRRTDSDSLVVIPDADRATFSADGRWLAFRMDPPDSKGTKGRKKSRRNRLGLLDLESGDTTIIGEVSAFAFSDDGAYLAMRRYPPKKAKDGAPDLVVRDLARGVDTRFGNVEEYAWQDDGPLLAMVIDAEDDAGNGVQLYDPARGTLRTLDSAPTRYAGLAWRPADDDLAVLRVREDEGYEDTAHVILAWRDLEDDGMPEPYRFDPAEADGFPAATRVVDFRELRWAENGRTLFFGIKARTPEAPDPDTADAEGKDEDDEDDDPARVLVWHAKDVDIIPRQKVTAERDRKENHLAAWHLDAGRFVRLGDDVVEDVRVLEGDRRAVGTDETPYDVERMFGPVYRDLYVIDVETGERRKVKERVQYVFGPSPGGRYLLYLEDDHYWTYDIERDRHTRITDGLAAPFVDHDDDHTVEQKPPFGVAGWTEDDRAVLLYSEYDIWRVEPDGSGAENLTGGAADSLRYRYVDLVREEAPDDDVIDPDAPLYLSVYHEWTEEHGFARLEMGDEPERLVWSDQRVDRLARAEDADVYLYRAQDFHDSPDYFVGGPDLRDARQVTRTNPFQKDYAWGRSELVEYENARGQRLQGALFYPADYEPGRKYPMIVYIYETRSPSVNQYVVPTDEHPYNTSVFTSQGYFVFQPDIVYRDRNPGLSAVEAIVPAVETVLETGRIDPDRVGLVGHSWGGYQTAFTVTQTDLFRTAVAGAPLTNLVSMYNSIYWRTGGTDARIFEISQGRMEVPPWEDMAAYTANSPLHNIERLNTPLLVAFGDDDGAVEFNQGVEFYNAARRAGKDLVMLVYAGENHGISRRDEDRRDYHRRVLQWFDHYLKDAPAPRWITHGIPYLEQIEQREKPRT